ncbi:LysR family transcriptional regulator [Roseobacter sp. HKCCA0882]|uniref:LysR family transcriptional regulator n=1 Tax=Roseobacter sp. HKCCA0882 TaxID=3120337 RepID=UPI0030EEF3C9
MYRDLPPLTWLRAFEASARLLSFTAAAHELNLTQAAISKHVKSLELRLKRQLFIRHPRSLEMTKWAEAYLPKVQDSLQRLSRGTREVFGSTQGDVLTIRCAISFLVNVLSEKIPKFLADHPDQKIRIISSVWVDAFDHEAYDFDIQYGTGTFPGAKSYRLSYEKITPVCAPSRAKTLKHPEQLSTERLIHVQGYQDGWGTWLNAANLQGVDHGLGLQVDNSLAAYELAAQDAGIALGRSSLVANDLKIGRLVAPFEFTQEIEEGFFLLEPLTSTTRADAAAFAKWLLNELQ